MGYEMQECENCSQDVLVLSSYSVKVVCPDCVQSEYSRCDDCSEWVQNGDSYHVVGNTVCDSCHSDHYGTCDECQEDFSSDDLTSGYCNDCKNSAIIKSYDYEREDGIKKRGNGPWYGLELEVYPRNTSCDSVAEDILEELNAHNAEDWVAKEDGSVSNGFELESQPFSKDAIQDSLRIIESYSDRLKGFHGDNNGLHISVDAPASRLHRFKVLTFMNNPGNKALLEFIGQRTLNTFCDQIKVRTWDVAKGYSTPKYAPVRIDGGRMEFRIFKANLLRSRINKAIDFCQAVLDYTEHAPLSRLQVLCKYDFMAFLMTNQLKYPDLANYVVERNGDSENPFRLMVSIGELTTYQKRQRAEIIKTMGEFNPAQPVELPGTLELVEA